MQTKIDGLYFTVHKWMIDDLKLKTVERDVFAVIFGFSKDGETKFSGSLSYLASLTGYSKNSICTALKNLVEKGFIIKTEKDFNGVKLCKYHVDLYTVQATCTPIQATCTNNIDNNIDTKKDIISKDITSVKPGKFKLKSPVENSRPSLYNNCVAFIYSYNPSEELRTVLIEYLKFRINIKEKPLYTTMWNGMLKKLFSFSEDEQVAIVNQSIELGYLSFYPLKTQKTKKRLSEPEEGTGCEQATEEENKKQGKFIKDLTAKGKRVTF